MLAMAEVAGQHRGFMEPCRGRDNKIRPCALQEKMAEMVGHLASLAEGRLVLSFAPSTPYFLLLKRIGEFFPKGAKVCYPLCIPLEYCHRTGSHLSCPSWSSPPHVWS